MLLIFADGDRDVAEDTVLVMTRDLNSQATRLVCLINR
jgi:hypothetical protein